MTLQEGAVQAEPLPVCIKMLPDTGLARRDSTVLTHATARGPACRKHHVGSCRTKLQTVSESHNLLLTRDSTHVSVTRHCSLIVTGIYEHTRVMHANKVQLVKRSISFPPQLCVVRLHLPFIPIKGGSRGRSMTSLICIRCCSQLCCCSPLQDDMLGLRKYVGVSGLTASAVIYHAFYTREQ